MFKRLIFIGMIYFLFIVSSSAWGATTNAITQWGITWNFDKDYEFGQFANGDYWVLGPVIITVITPEFDGLSNGWEVNPVVTGGQGFQSGCIGGGFDPALSPSLPYKSPTSGIVSIVKTISSGKDLPCIQTAAVLTVVTSVPPGNGLSVFRPPYVGIDKPYYYVSSIKKELLPAYPAVGAPTNLDYIAERFKRVRLDHKQGALGRAIRPADSMNDYQPENAPDICNAALRFMLSDPTEDKMPALIQYLQAGIDKVHTIWLGQTWPAGGGHQPAHVLPSAFTATMLDIIPIKTVLKNATFFHASEYIASTSETGSQVWGQNNTELAYWNYVMGLGGNRSNKDPYRYIDGGTCGDAYQLITSQAHKGEALASFLMPVLKEAWPASDLAYATNYAERWVNHGTQAQPDPCAPYDGYTSNYGITYGPDPKNPGRCILDPDLAYFNSPTDFKCHDGKECGRFVLKDGTNKDGGQYRSAFVAAMWDAYWTRTAPRNLQVQ